MAGRTRGTLGRVSTYAYKNPCKNLYAEDIAEVLGLNKKQVCGSFSQMRSVYEENVQIIKPGYVYVYHPGGCDGSCTQVSAPPIIADIHVSDRVLDFLKANQGQEIWCTKIMQALGGATAKEVRAAIKHLRDTGYASNIRTVQNDLWVFSTDPSAAVAKSGGAFPLVRFVGRLETGDVILEIEGKAYRAIPMLSS
jgi:hypothetical protein